MTKKLFTVLALLALAVAIVVTGCGSGVPSNSVATVSGTNCCGPVEASSRIR